MASIQKSSVFRDKVPFQKGEVITWTKSRARPQEFSHASPPGNPHHHIPLRETRTIYREVPWLSPAWSVTTALYIHTKHRSNSAFRTWQLAAIQQLQDKKGTFGSYCLKYQVASTMLGHRTSSTFHWVSNLKDVLTDTNAHSLTRQL